MRLDLDKLNRTSGLKISVLDRRVEAVAHPLHAALSWPVNGEVTSPFRDRGCCSFHPGVVVAAGEESGYGNRVVVEQDRPVAALHWSA